jgi:ferredoxin
MYSKVALVVAFLFYSVA